MISYAQNLEDVLLGRALNDVKQGFYIDVGANHPTLDSITNHFYLLGWRGVNVEPSSVYAALAAARTRDVNLNAAVSKSRGQAVFYEFATTANSTLNRDQAEKRRESLGWNWTERKIDLVPLADICEQHAKGVIDFMSIDVEGHELEVLQSNDWLRNRPRIVVVEATLPCTTIPSHHAWEHVLLDAGYHFAVFDGLNRFYVRDEDSKRIASLQVHPNLFDEYTSYHVQERLHALEARIRELEAVRLPGPPRPSRRYSKQALRFVSRPFEQLARGVKRWVRARAS